MTEPHRRSLNPRTRPYVVRTQWFCDRRDSFQWASPMLVEAYSAEDAVLQVRTTFNHVSSGYSRAWIVIDSVSPMVDALTPHGGRHSCICTRCGKLWTHGRPCENCGYEIGGPEQ